MIRLQRGDFDPGREVEALVAGRAGIGGIATFTGVVRGSDGGGAIRSMTLEHYPGMTERMMEAIEREANGRWSLEASLVIHRYGRLVPGDRIVLVATAAPHRRAALESCGFLIDWLKTKAPFWKREETEAGERWVEARTSDDEAALRWEREPA